MKNFVKYLACGILLMFVSCYDKNENNFIELSKHQLIDAKVSVNGVNREDADTTCLFRTENGFSVYTKNIIVVDADDKINIVLNSKFENGFTPEYKWEMFETTPVEDPITGEYLPSILLSNTKDIEFIIKGAPIEYSVVCTITNSNDGTKDYICFIFKINKPNGLAVIYEGVNGGDFDFFKSKNNILNLTKPEFYRNIYSSANNSYIKNPQTLHFAKGSWGAADVFVVFNENSMLSLDSKTYKVSSVDQTDFFALSPPVYSESDILPNASYIYGVFNGEIYFSNAGLRFKNSIDPANKYYSKLIKNDGSASSKAYYVFFDMGAKAFRYGNFNGGINKFTTAAGSLFDVNDTKMDLIYAESGYNLNVNAIMKSGSELFFNVIDLQFGKKLGTDSDGKIIIQNEVSVLYQNNITSLNGLTTNSLWAMHTRSERAFYSSGNKVYLYNRLTNLSSEFITVTGNISMLKVYKHTNQDLNSKTLYVGTDAGKLYEFDYDVISGEKIGEPTIYDIDGKPINLKYI